MTTLRLDFCGVVYEIDPAAPFVIGRDGPDADLELDDNPHLHRRFLQLRCIDDQWWIENVGTTLSATISEATGTLQSWLGPAGRLPLVFAHCTIRFSVGATAYELDLYLDEPAFSGSAVEYVPVESLGEATLGGVALTLDQRLLILALAEPALRYATAGRGELPSSAAAAQRLGWPITKFNRKLDNVCQKLKREGVRGLHGDADNLASSRRARLVEYALAVRLVTRDELSLLELPPTADA
jgi:hypothetical protein